MAESKAVERPTGPRVCRCRSGHHHSLLSSILVGRRAAVARRSLGGRSAVRPQIGRSVARAAVGRPLQDMFIDQCLSKVLGVKRVDDWNLISEPHCASKGWEECKSQHVAFHPFKTKSSYEACLERANFGALPFEV